MQAHYHFAVQDVLPLVDHALSAESHQPTYDQLGDPRFRLDGDDLLSDDHPNIDKFKEDQIDATLLPPALILVKDRGLYLLSSGRPGLQDSSDPTGIRQHVVYAFGCNPDVNDDWYEFVRMGCGGDDFAIPLELDDGIVEAMRQTTQGSLVLKIDPEQIEITVIDQPPG